MIGVETEVILQRFLTALPVRMEAAKSGAELHSVIVQRGRDHRQGAGDPPAHHQRRLKTDGAYGRPQRTELISLTVQVLGRAACSVPSSVSCGTDRGWCTSGCGAWPGWRTPWRCVLRGALRQFAASGLALRSYALFVFVFAMVLVAAAQAGFAAESELADAAAAIAGCLPDFLCWLVPAREGRPHRRLSRVAGRRVRGVYFYNFAVVGGYTGAGGNLFRLSLFVLFAAVRGAGSRFCVFLLSRASSGVGALPGTTIVWPISGCDCVLTFFAMAMWIEIQNRPHLEIARRAGPCAAGERADQDLDF